MRQEYYYEGRKKITFLDFCRNVLIAKLPESCSRLSRSLVPYEPHFIFFTHPRNEDDILATFPFLQTFSKFVPRKIVLRLLDLSPCYFVSNVVGPNNTQGYFISITKLPDRLFSSRELTVRLIRSSISFFRKISKQKVYIGLAAWWPIVSNSGLLFQKHLREDGNLVVTSGHTATLASLYLSVLRLSRILQIPAKDLKVLIIGVGKVGGALADLFIKEIGKIGLIDKNAFRVNTVKKNLAKITSSVEVEAIAIREQDSEDIIAAKIQEYNISVCTTSNTGLLISDEEKLKNCIILDDSRPEAFPRLFSETRKALVLEGGLMKIPNVKMDSDFGFGTDENIFGCLSEAIMLAMDQSRKFKPNVGEVDFENLVDLIELCKISNIQEGEFKCGKETITAKKIKSVFLSARTCT